jgi:hypothetical protein
VSNEPVIQYRCQFNGGYKTLWRDYDPHAHHATLDMLYSTGVQSIELREKQEEAESGCA